MENQATLQSLLMRQAILDEENRLQPEQGAALGATAGAVLGTLTGVPIHMKGRHDMSRQDSKNPVMVERGGIEGQMYRKDMMHNKARPGARMAGGLVGALAGGALGAGTAELVKRESPSARLIAKIQTQNGRLTPQDEQIMEGIITNLLSNPSQYRNAA